MINRITSSRAFKLNDYEDDYYLPLATTRKQTIRGIHEHIKRIHGDTLILMARIIITFYDKSCAQLRCRGGGVRVENTYYCYFYGIQFA